MNKRTSSHSVEFYLEIGALGTDGPFPGSKVTALTYDVKYTVTPGDPGCRYTKNGDGWPPSGPEIEWQATLTKLEGDGIDRVPTDVEAATAKWWLEESDDGEEVHDSLQEFCFERASEDMEPDDDY